MPLLAAGRPLTIRGSREDTPRSSPRVASRFPADHEVFCTRMINIRCGRPVAMSGLGKALVVMASIIVALSMDPPVANAGGVTYTVEPFDYDDVRG